MATVTLLDRTTIQRKPAWIRVKAPTSEAYHDTRRLMRGKGLHTVCEEAACPNIGECWAQKHATVMILGDTCTRACAFCNVKTGAPLAVDPHEPAHLAEVVATMGLAHVVITSVDRDDLPDGGAFQFVRCIEAIRAVQPGHDDRDPDPRLPAQAGRGRGDRRGAARRLQPQSRDRAAPLPHRPARRALLPLAAPAAAGQGAGPDPVHQVRHHGRPGRGEARGPPGDGRHALGRHRFPHHRPVPAARPRATTRSSASSSRPSSRATPAWPGPRASSWSRPRR